MTLWNLDCSSQSSGIPIKLILLFRELCNAEGGEEGGGVEVQNFWTSNLHTEWKSKYSLPPILVAPIAAGPIATSVYIFFYMIGTGFRSVPWLWNRTGGSSCWSELENDKCRQDTPHQKLMPADGAVGLNSLHSAPHSPVLPASTSASLGNPLCLFWRETHPGMHLVQDPVIVPSTLECAQQSDSASSSVLRGVVILMYD